MNNSNVEQWGIFELALEGPKEGNPFLEVELTARFTMGNRVVEVEGFYDGEGIYKIRFMPDTVGEWSYETISSAALLNGMTGQLKCIEPAPGNHGPVRVQNTYHFAYEDGTPYFQIGTTCYVWNHQGDEMEEKTVETLKTAPFNKMRMCVFPKNYDYNHNDPVYYPFEGTREEGWDFTRFNPEYFWHLEKRIQNLMDLEIEADLILFHPYDNGRWGFDKMDRETDELYLRYIVARLSAFRNIWWSFANEYDFLGEKSMEDWDGYFQLVESHDPYGHLRSIHNCNGFYDHSKPWVTHCSIQDQSLSNASDHVMRWREQYKKPVVLDEVGYEGNIQHGWGNLTPQELLRRFWEGTIGGGYVGHGETYYREDEVLWWSKGGVLHGQSPERIAFLRKIMEEGPSEGLTPIKLSWDLKAGHYKDEYYLVYFGMAQPSFRPLNLPEGEKYKVEVIDTWEMTITELDGVFEGSCRIELPGKPYMALRIRKIEA